MLSSCERGEVDVGKVATQIFEVSGNPYHGCVVGAVLHLGNEATPMMLVAYLLQLVAQRAIGTNAASYGHLTYMRGNGGFLEFFEQEPYYTLLYAGTEVGFVLLDIVGVLFQFVAQIVKERGLYPTETKVVAGNIGRGKAM